jgi:hypothetical protein
MRLRVAAQSVNPLFALLFYLYTNMWIIDVESISYTIYSLFCFFCGKVNINVIKQVLQILSVPFGF